VLLAVSAGGALGALARYGITMALPVEPGSFDVATFAANTIGGLLIGVLMVIVTEVRPGAHHIRPFFGVGVLGGFTTFSAYILDIGLAANAGQTFVAVAFAFASIAAALLAAALGMNTTRRALARRRRTTSETTDSTTDTSTGQSTGQATDGGADT
jgi:fluoride exporter